MSELMLIKDIKNLPASLKVTDVSKILGVSRPVALQMCHSKKFPMIRAGRRIIVPTRSFFEWFEGGDSNE